MSSVSSGRMEAEKGWTRELLYQLVENVRVYAIFATGLDGNIATWNIGAELIFGFTAGEAIGMPAEVLFTPQDRAAGVPFAEMDIARERRYSEDERWHVRKDGSVFYASGIQTAIYDDRGELTGFIKIARDLTERLKFQEDLDKALGSADNDERTRELEDANEDLRRQVVDTKRSEEIRIALLRKIVSTQENERKRISREIHDNIGQQVTALQFKLVDLISASSDAPALGNRLREMQTVIDQIDSEVDFLAWELRPAVLDDLGLSAAVENFVVEWSEHFEIPAEFSDVNMSEKKLPQEIEINLYRIAQEALNNICKHASATQASVVLERSEGDVVLVIEDNGVGFSAEKGIVITENDRGLGLLGMKERAELVGGRLEIESSPGAGTTIFVRVPATFEGRDSTESIANV